MVRCLDRKALRDLAQLRGQVLTIAMVIASAIAGFVGSLSTYKSLDAARREFYQEAHFGDVFATIKRAPFAIERELAALDGIVEIETTLVQDATLDVPGVAEPVTGRVIGLDPRRPQRLDQLRVRAGRELDPAAVDEAIVSEAFANARRIVPGDSIVAVLNGRRATLRVVGLGTSPGYIYATGGGAFPDDRNFGVLWLRRDRVEAAYDMRGAFNAVSVRLAPRANERAVIDALNHALARYGGDQAYGRAEQLSNRILDQEIGQWKILGTVIPSIFMGVAVFLLNVVLARQVATQREQIATLKALGYSDGRLLAHYLEQVAVVVALGALLGVLLGIGMSHGLTGLYARYFRFPHDAVLVDPLAVIGATAIAGAAAFAAAATAVRRVVTLAPAEGMRPPQPARFRPMLVDRLGWRRAFRPDTRMLIRNLERSPWRTSLTIVGIASAVAIVIVGCFWRDAFDYLIEVQFEAAQPADAEIVLTGPASPHVRDEVARLPGVIESEGSRSVPARLVFEHRDYRTAILGVTRDARLRRLLDADVHDVPLPRDGLLMTGRLAERLGVSVGDRVRVELLEGNRAIRDVVVAGTVRDLIGLFAYMDVDALGRLSGEPGAINGVSVRLDPALAPTFFSALKDRNRVATAASKRSMLQNFRETAARNVLVFTAILTAFAAVIAVGVVYNNARIALAERAWELASLRVLGFSRAEVSGLLLGELAIEIVFAIPLGWLAGYGLSWTIVRLTHMDMVEIPVFIAPHSYAYAALAVIFAGAVSALLVRRRVDRLDLVGVLKTRE